MAWLVAIFASPSFATPRHVVSAFLCTDEYVFRLLPRDRIAALSFLAADRHPVVSTIADEVQGIALVHESAEEILSHHPDAVMLYAGTEPRLHAQLREAGIPIIDVPWANSLADIRAITTTLGRTLGEDARAQALVREMDRELSAAHGPRPMVRTVIYEPNGYVTSDAVTDAILKSAGLADVANEIGPTRSGTIPVEAMVASPPELLLLNASDERHPSLANLVLHHPALANLAPRIMVSRVLLTPLLCPGPWSVGIAPHLAELGWKARALARPQTRP